MAMLVRNGTMRRGDATLGAEAVAPAADGDAQSITADDLPALRLGCLACYSRQGQFRLYASVSNSVNKPLFPAELNSHFKARES